MWQLENPGEMTERLRWSRTCPGLHRLGLRGLGIPLDNVAFTDGFKHGYLFELGLKCKSPPRSAGSLLVMAVDVLELGLLSGGRGCKSG